MKIEKLPCSSCPHLIVGESTYVANVNFKYACNRDAFRRLAIKHKNETTMFNEYKDGKIIFSGEHIHEFWKWRLFCRHYFKVVTLQGLPLLISVASLVISIMAYIRSGIGTR
jgi:hypothetical protein